MGNWTQGYDDYLKEHHSGEDGPIDWLLGNNSSSNSTWLQGLNNQFTGNLDYQRQVELQNLAQTFSAQESQKQRDFEEELSNTAYQRGIADMRKAGLNPYLLYGSGHTMQASTPTGASASGIASNAPVSGKGWQMLLNAVGMLATSAINARTAKINASVNALSRERVAGMRNLRGRNTESFDRNGRKVWSTFTEYTR